MSVCYVCSTCNRNHKPGVAAAGSCRGVRKGQFRFWPDFILEAGGSKLGRAGPGRAVAQVGAGAGPGRAVAQVGAGNAWAGANANRGQMGPK